MTTEFAPQLKLLSHPETIRAFLDGDWKAAPIGVEISPTNDCNARCPWCAVAGTLIDTPVGLVPIELVRTGDKVFGPDGDVCTVTSTGSRYVDEVCVIRSGGRELRVSGEHPFLTDSGWRDARRLRAGDAAVVRVRMRQSSEASRGTRPEVAERAYVEREKEAVAHGPAPSVPVRLRRSCRGEARQVAEVCEEFSHSEGSETVCGATGSNIRPDEAIQPHEEKGRSRQGVGNHEGETSTLQRRTREEAGRDVAREDAVRREPNERPRDCAEVFRGQGGDGRVDLEVRAEIQELGRRERLTAGTHGQSESLDSPTQPRLSCDRSEEVHRADAGDGISARSDSSGCGELRSSVGQALHIPPLAVPCHLLEGDPKENSGIAGGYSGLCIAGIKLERGLELRPIDSVSRERGRIQVFNFSCEPLEAYEANGFAVHNCFYVSGEYKQKHSKEELGHGECARLIYDLSEMGVKSITWTGGGDPSVYSLIDEMINYAGAMGIRQGMFTNAYQAIRRPEKLDWIRITVTEKFVITKHVAEYAKKTKVGVNFNLCRANEQHLAGMVKQAREAGVAYFQVRPALADRADLQEYVECPKWLEHYSTKDFRIVMTDYKWEDYLRPHGYPVCHGHRAVPFVWHNGDVAVCAYHFGRPEFTFGNLSEGGFRAVWEGERRRKMITEGNVINVIPACQHNCKLHESNKAFAALAGDLRPSVSDLEFV